MRPFSLNLWCGVATAPAVPVLPLQVGRRISKQNQYLSHGVYLRSAMKHSGTAEEVRHIVGSHRGL